MSVAQQNASTDTSGRQWARLSELKAGDKVSLDRGFSCRAGKSSVVEVKADENGSLYFDCNDGKHYLSGQVGKYDHLIGVYKVEA